MEQRNYDEFDYMRVLVNLEFFDEIMASYNCFGWELSEKRESSSFSDTLEVILKRKHKIKNKDRLQLLQVHMESAYGDLARLRKNKYAKSTAIGLTAGMLATAIICFFIFFVTKTTYVTAMVFGIIITVLASLLLIRLLFGLSSIKKVEDFRFKTETSKIASEINKICADASKTVKGGDNGKD